MNSNINSKEIDQSSLSKLEIIEFTADMGEHVAICMQRIADVWSQSSIKNSHNSKIRTDDNEFPSMERLNAYASDLEVELKFQQEKIKNLKAEQFPCIVMLKNGRGIIVKSRTKDGFVLFQNDQEVKVSKTSFQACVSDIVIIVQPKSGKVEDNVLGSISPVKSSSPSQGYINNHEEQAHKKRIGLRKLASLIVREKRSLMFQLGLTACVNNLVMVVLPLFIMTVYDRVIPHIALETLWALALGVFLVLGIDVAIRYVRLIIVDAIGLSMSTKIQTKLYDRLINSRMNSAPRSMSDWVSAFRDIETATTLVPSLIVALLIDIPFVALVLLLVYSMAGPVVWAPIVGITVVALWILISQRLLISVSRTETDVQNKKMNDFAETVNSLTTIKAVGAQQSRLTRFERLVDTATHSSHQSRLHSLLPSQITMVVVQAVIVCAVIIGVYQISAGEMSVGALAASTLLVGRVLLPVSNVLSLLSRGIQISKSITRVFELIDLPQERAGDSSRSGGVSKGHLALQKVSFQYPETELLCLDNVSINIKPGEKVAIVGRSGCGKSSLLKLLVRFFDPVSGSYNIDSADARQVAPDVVRQSFAYMPQEAELFDGTVKENIFISNPNASEEEFERAVSISGVKDFIRHQPDGYSLRVGPRGERISGGERQAIALARTMLAPSKAVFLDEPTSSMDNTMEAAVIRGIHGDLGDTTLVISTHRANVLSIVDRIIWMERGKVVADGPRQEVLANLKKSA